jgi:hypothetical protein
VFYVGGALRSPEVARGSQVNTNGSVLRLIQKVECLNQNWFISLDEARRIIEAWRVDYNTVRPHSSLGYRTPAEFAAEIAGEQGCGKAAAWKSTNHFSTPLGNPANPAGFPLSHSHAGDGLIRHVAQEVQNQAPSANL